MLTMVTLLFWFNNRKEKSLFTLSLGGVVTAIGTMLAYFPAGMGAWPMLITNTAILMLFHPLAVIATRQAFSRQPLWCRHLLICVPAMLAYIYWAGGSNFDKRVVVTSSTHLLCWSLIVYQLFRNRHQAPPIAYRLLLGVASLMVATSLFRLFISASGYKLDFPQFNLLASLALFWIGFSFGLSILYLGYERLLLQLQDQAQQDGLTRLYNHRTFKEKAEQLFEHARQKRMPLALLLIDLDHFKSINDRFGHQAGDDVLKELADCLRQEARQTDLLGRHGGEEFVMLLPCTNDLEACNVANRLRLAIHNLNPVVDGRTLSISGSIGVACARHEEHGNLAELFLEADMLLYQAKHRGRNRVESSRSVQPCPSLATEMQGLR
ncbi:GGDEF domain-containing protein [Chromobacterium sp. IIBBL 290-4]|uniref:GGDEF domain-containing protein n=1 Tax=Chromobacterium sp. IIBBL 290-4 TaxID=2953890 RepID=UPI0020B87B28|nr:GGDEF domain-containing protein [Chromobacterium sp. IIBBL 290-4]UTH72813.1 GGDEF domain-containing protein [Chromobacterium sp. IIBBL 290-4]